MQEVEIKFRIERSSISGLVSKLGVLGYEHAGDMHQVDAVYLGAGHKSFATFTPGDVVARVRLSNDEVSLTTKRKLGDSNNEEYEVVCSDYATAKNILAALGMNEVVEVDKTRIEYKKDSITVTLDEVKNLGHYVEIEILVPIGGDASAAENTIMETAASLGLGTDDIEPKKYDALLMAK
jgi:adenylate cyclase, class 2